jgi:hypothetical protein
MRPQVYRYEFAESVDIAEAEASFMLATLATTSLHGELRVRLEARHVFSAESHSCVIDARGEVGRDLNRLFLGFVTREFGADSFRVTRVPPDSVPASTLVA